MTSKHLVLLLLASFLATSALAKSKLAWQALEKLPPGTHIYVLTNLGYECSLQRVTDDKLYCTTQYPGSRYKVPHEPADLVFNRADIHHLCDSTSEECSARENYLCVGDQSSCYVYDESAGVPALIAAAGAGGGWHPGYQPNSLAGVKLGLGGLAMDLQHDRLNAHNGFSVEGSGIIPLFRVPRWQPKKDRLFFRAWAEPGLGYRAGDGPFGQYASAKALVLIGDKWVNDGVSPYVEVQRRFPFNSPLDGDNRIAVGLMITAWNLDD